MLATAPLKSLRLMTLILVALSVWFAQPLDGFAANPNPHFKNIRVFGDSLSDTGNLFAITAGILPATSPPYYQGRYSNGPIWVETLAQLLGIEVDSQTNITVDPLASIQAVGGAFTDIRNSNAVIVAEAAGTGIQGQISQFEDAKGRIKGNELVIVFGGANDYLFDPFSEPLTVVDNLKRAVEDLEALGGQFFIVPNLPNLGDTPLALDLGLQVPLNNLTAAHNSLLEVAMAELEEDLNVDILVLDINTAFTALVDSGLFANVTVPCIIQNPPFAPTPTLACVPFQDGVPDSTVNGGTFYMDVVHPTTQVHSLLAAFAHGAISNIWSGPVQSAEAQ